MTHFAEDIERFLASFSSEETAVMRYAFQAVLKGEPPSIDDLLHGLGLAPSSAHDAVQRLLERGTLVLEDGRITGARGLSLTETPHRLTLAGSPRYAFCAVDAVGIPVALGLDAAVDSHCHHCGRPVRLEIHGGTIVDAPAGLVIWAVERDLTRSLRAHT